MLRRLMAVACNCRRSSRRAPSPIPRSFDVVRIADRGFLTNAPIYIAEEEGYFADERIRLKYTEPPRSSAQMIPLLERGDLDVMAPAVTAAFFAAVAQGSKSRIVADRGHVAPTGCDYDGVMVRRGLFNGEPRRRRTCAASGSPSVRRARRHSCVEQVPEFARAMSTADVEMVSLGETVEAQALEAGSIDGLHVAEPYL